MHYKKHGTRSQSKKLANFASGGGLDKRRHGNINVAIINSGKNPTGLPAAGGAGPMGLPGAPAGVVPQKPMLPPAAGGAPGRIGFKKGGRVKRAEGGSVNAAYSLASNFGKQLMSSPDLSKMQTPSIKSQDMPRPQKVEGVIPGSGDAFGSLKKAAGGAIGGVNHKYPHMTAGSHSGVGRLQKIIGQK